jgi:hypothetical protein
VVAHEEALAGREVALAAHRLPAHLGVRPDRDEPFRWQRLDDRPSRRLLLRKRHQRARIRARPRQQRNRAAELDQLAPRQPVLAPGEPAQLLGACMEVFGLLDHSHRSDRSLFRS